MSGDVIYLRDRHPAGLQRQRTLCRERALASGWGSLVEYSDQAGVNQERPGYRQLLADLEAGKVSRLMVWSLDRLARDPGDLDHLLRVASEHGATVHLSDRPHDHGERTQLERELLAIDKAGRFYGRYYAAQDLLRRLGYTGDQWAERKTQLRQEGWERAVARLAAAGFDDPDPLLRELLADLGIDYWASKP